MGLPHNTITPIPNNEPDAVPSLWNTRYQEIDKNFENLDGRASAVESEIHAARAGREKLADTVNAIVTQIGGVSGALNGMASPVSVQTAVSLDWLYRGRRIAFELFADGYRLQNSADIAVVSGVSGDDSLDVASTANVKSGQDLILKDNASTVLVRVTDVLSGSRLRLSANLTKNWGNDAVLTGSTLVSRAGGGVDAAAGAQWVSRVINLGEDNLPRSVIIRRTLNAGEARLYFRDAYTPAWTERPWSVRRSGGGASGVPEGFADYEYVIPMRGDGYLRLVMEGEPAVIRHIVAIGAATGLGGYVNPLMSPAAPTVSSPAAGATNVLETPTLTLAGFSSPAGNAFATAQFQISASNTFASVLHDSGDKQALTYSVPAGVMPVNTVIHVRARVKDVAGLTSAWSAIASFTTKASYAYINTPAVTSPSNGQLDVADQPTLQTSAFAATGGSDTHASSQWQIRLASGSWAAPLHDSGASATAKTSYTVPAGVLQAGQTQYVMRVRHTGATLGASEWSNDVTFTTRQQFATIMGIVMTATSGGAGGWQRVDGNFNAITTTSATFNAHPTYAGIVPQTVDGQEMIKIPKFYVKTGTVPSGAYAGKRYWMISDAPAAGFVAHPAFMSAGAEVAQIWLGKYKGCLDGASKLGSLGSGTLASGLTIGDVQAKANARNVSGVSGFMLWSVYHLAAIQTLALIEMGGSDSQALIGATDTWRGITGLWLSGGTSSGTQFIDGIRSNAGSAYEIWDKNGNKTWQTTTKLTPGNGAIVTTATDTGANYDLSFTFLPGTVEGSVSPTPAQGSFGADYTRTTFSTVARVCGENIYWQGLFFFELDGQTAGGRLAKV